jgi:hypothetical protein
MPGSARVSRATSVRVRLLASRQNDVLERGFEVKEFARHIQRTRCPLAPQARCLRHGQQLALRRKNRGI